MIDFERDRAWTIENFLPPAECQRLIDKIEELGPTEAPISTSRGFVMRPDLRNNTRAIFDDVELAQRCFNRAKPYIPQKVDQMRAIGTNERFRCYRYEPGQYFAPHMDGAYYRDNKKEWSLLTLIVYLNDNFTGGETNFLDLRQSITPKTGMALLFQHAILHEGAAVKTGVKYAARTDVMYRYSK